MGDYLQDFQEEVEYLEKTLSFINRQLEADTELLGDRKSKLISSRRDMWENTSHSSRDFTKLTEANQYLTELHSQNTAYKNLKRQIDRFQRIIGSPYFGRFDFIEDGMESKDKIYIGLYNVIDSKTHEIYVYDWRAPVSSIFYNSELGSAAYDAPIGSIKGEVTLKRQYKIKDSRLEYFIDCSVRISDEMLQEVLSRNSSAKMRNIVETIQKEQNVIIRDTGNELLIVQGVAGSGKTSIALHRIAYLLYEGINSKTGSNNIIIVSPNAVFSKYISSVLPELGEDNVGQITFDEIAAVILENRFVTEKWIDRIESVIRDRSSEEGLLKSEGIEFKGSRAFTKILDRLLTHFERHMLHFEDIYFGGKIIETRQQIKNIFLGDKLNLPLAKRLKRIESTILEKIHPMQKHQLDSIQSIVHNKGGHEYEVRSFSRLLSLKRTRALTKRLKRFTEVDYFNLYKMLFSDSRLFKKLSKGLDIPGHIESILTQTRKRLEKGYIGFEDCTPLLYLKLKIEGGSFFDGIKQIVIDEAQDYYPLQFEVFKLLFKDAGYTVLGDLNQAIEKDAGNSLYDEIIDILDKKSSMKLILNKSYRASYEINTFTRKLLGEDIDLISFERHEAEPVVVRMDSLESKDNAIVNDIKRYFEEGYESAAVVCKTRHEAEKAYERLNSLLKVTLVSPEDGEVQKGVSVMPAYVAKGLEFDVVIVYDAGKEYYSSPHDKKLLYVACTRALHRLAIYYSGEISPFLATLA